MLLLRGVSCLSAVGVGLDWKGGRTVADEAELEGEEHGEGEVDYGEVGGEAVEEVHFGGLVGVVVRMEFESMVRVRKGRNGKKGEKQKVRAGAPT